VSDSNPNPIPANRSARAFGVILMIIGYLLLTAAGFCTLVFSPAIFSGARFGPHVLVIGGIPMILGAFIAWAGHSLWRRGTGR
jgi:predicted phage tail protein